MVQAPVHEETEGYNPCLATASKQKKPWNLSGPRADISNLFYSLADDGVTRTDPPEGGIKAPAASH
jgi:hypothetical protein